MDVELGLRCVCAWGVGREGGKEGKIPSAELGRVVRVRVPPVYCLVYYLSLSNCVY